MKAHASVSARLYTVLVLVLALASAAACTQSPEAKKQKAVERAEVYLKDGKANEAIIELRNALQIDKGYVPALHALGRAYAAKAWYGDAIRELSGAQKGAPDSVPIAIELGRAFIESGSFAEGEKQADFVLSREPQNAHALHIRAAARLGAGKVDEALAVLDGIVRAGQSLPGETAPLRAQALARRGKLAEAEEAYRAAVKENPKDVKSLIGLGFFHLQRREFAEAEKLFSQAKANGPANIDVQIGLAASAAGQDKLPEAIKILESIEVRARTVRVVLALAGYYLRTRAPFSLLSSSARPATGPRGSFSGART